MSAAGLGLMRTLRPRRDRKFDTHGRCEVCGFTGRFVVNSWMLPPHAAEEWGTEWVAAFRLRESSFCRRCASTLRIRRFAQVLLEHYGNGSSSAAELVRSSSFRELDIAEINRLGSLHRFLNQLPRLRYSEYADGGEDIQALSWPDQSLDLVLSSDTLEHVPDWQQALNETRRVLRKGGRHVLTVPLVPTQAQTVSVQQRGWFHGAGTGPYSLVPKRDDYTVRTSFGTDLLETLAQFRFEPEWHFRDAASVICALAV